MKIQQQAGIPTLRSIYNDTWSGDISADPDFLPTEPDDFAESSDEPEGDLEPELNIDEEENGDEEWYVQWLIKV